MNRKLLFFDIDGTLTLGGSAQVSRKVKSAIREARKKGHLVFLSTGRTESLVDDAIKEIGFDGGIYSAGGKVVLGTKKIVDYPLKGESVQNIMKILSEEKDVIYCLECDGVNYYGNLNEKYVLSNSDSVKEEFSSEIQRMLSFVVQSGKRDILEYDNAPVYKVSFFSANEAALKRICHQLPPLWKSFAV